MRLHSLFIYYYINNGFFFDIKEQGFIFLINFLDVIE